MPSSWWSTPNAFLPIACEFFRSVREGEGLLRRGVEMREGDRLLQSGKRILLADVGTLASVGKAHVAVSKRPRVAIIATGDELVEVRENPDASRIRNSNSYSLHAQVTEAGAEPVMLGIARDNLPDLREKIRLGLEHDIVLVSGGVSMGKYDFVEDVFSEFGVKVLFDQVAMKPGKPTVFGHRGDTFVFGLPGNPVSTMVAFRMFVRPLILKLLKADDTRSPQISKHSWRCRQSEIPRALLSFRLWFGLKGDATGFGRRRGKARRTWPGCRAPMPWS